MGRGRIKDHITPAMCDKMIALWHQGVNVPAIAARFGINSQFIRNVLHESGIARTRRKEWYSAK